MVTGITPNYYAADNFLAEFTVTGHNFDLLPDDIIGVMSNSNNNPLDNLKRTDEGYYCVLSSKNNSTMIFSSQIPLRHYATYLGAIVNSNRIAVYYVNNAQPLH